MSKNWVAVGGGGPIEKWTTPGQAVEGRYLGKHKGKFGPLGTFEIEGGKKVVMPLHTALENRLESVAVGADVRIVYKGKTRGKSGNEYKDFDVFVDAPEGGSAPVTPMSDAARLESKLADKVGAQPSKLMLDALHAKYPEAPAYEKALRDLLVVHGIA